MLPCINLPTGLDNCLGWAWVAWVFLVSSTLATAGTREREPERRAPRKKDESVANRCCVDSP